MSFKGILKSVQEHPVRWGIILTVAIELVTVFFRFGLGLEATSDTGWMARFTFGIRIHHGYIGVVLILLYRIFRKRLRIMKIGFAVGLGLAISDIIHHFVILWIFVGSPEFDLFYPA